MTKYKTTQITYYLIVGCDSNNNIMLFPTKDETGNVIPADFWVTLDEPKYVEDGQTELDILYRDGKVKGPPLYRGSILSDAIEE